VEWIAAHRPTAGQLTEATGHMVAMHEQWDGPNYFTLWGLMAPQLVPMAMTALYADSSVDQIPPAMAESVTRFMENSQMLLPISAMSFMYEGWTIEPGPDGLTDEQKHAIATHTVHQLPERVEVLRVMTLGIGGGAAVTIKERVSGKVMTRTSVDGPVASSPDSLTLYGAMRGIVETLPSLYLLRGAADEVLNKMDGPPL
jgi:hypothetical protein